MATITIKTALNTLPYNTVQYTLPTIGPVEFYFYTNFIFDPLEQQIKKEYEKALPVPILNNGPSFGFNLMYLGSNSRILTLNDQLTTPLTPPFLLVDSVRLVPNSNLLKPLRYLGFGELRLEGDYPTKSTWDGTSLLKYQYE